MPCTVNINGLSAVHQGSSGMAMATVPDVCKTPSPAGPIPIPYPNIAMSSDLVSGTTTVTVDGSPAAIQPSKFVKSTGDEAGSAGGVVSGVFAMEATFISFSPTVTLDGKPACRLTDKMLMNKGNTVCMGGELQGPVPPAMPEDAIESVNPEIPKHCVLRGVIVSCGHSDRSLQLDLAKHDVTVLQVISKDTKPDKLTVEWDGTCGESHAFCPTVGVKGPNGWKAIDKATGTYEVPAPSTLLVRDWFWIFKVLAMQKDVTRDYHTIRSMLCQGHDSADVETSQWLQVQVFPEVEWSAKMSIGYEHENVKNAAGKKDPFHYELGSVWKIGGSVDAKFGATKFTYSLEAEQKADALPLFGSLLKLIGKTAMVFDSMSTFGLDVKITPMWPEWSMGGGMKLIELPKKPIVATQGNFKFGFEPLFGIKLSCSILDWLIRFAGGLAGPPGAILAQALVQVRQRFAKGVGDASSKVQASLDIDILITVDGHIDGGFGVKFADGKSDIDPEASEIKGKVGVQVEGHVIGKARIWRFDASGAGKVGVGAADGKDSCGITAGVKPKGGKDALSPKGEIGFTGMAFYYMLYLEVGVGGGESKKQEDADEGDDPKVTVKKPKSTTRLYEKSGTVVLMKPWTWPKEAGGGEG